MTEVVPVERILGPALEGHADYQSIRAESSIDVKDQRQGVASRAENSDDDEQNPNTDKDSMARISWTCCKSKWFVYDGLGITCAGITYGLIVYALFVVIGVILLTDFPSSPWAYLHSILFTLLAVLAISAHARSMTTDPVSEKCGIFEAAGLFSSRSSQNNANPASLYQVYYQGILLIICMLTVLIRMIDKYRPNTFCLMLDTGSSRKADLNID